MKQVTGAKEPVDGPSVMNRSASYWLRQTFKKIKDDSFNVVWPWGQEEHFGPQLKPPRFRLKIRTYSAISQILADPVLGFGEAYMDGEIEVEGDVHDVVVMANLNRQEVPGMVKKLAGVVRGFTRGATTKESRQDIASHYDLGNEFFKLFLDPTLSYSCAYFRSPEDTLVQAQKNKIRHILRKLQLKPGMRLLDIGCGWGQLIITAAQEFGVYAIGITHSQEQLAKVQERIKELGLEDKVEVYLRDYRDLQGENVFDRIVSVGMYEHVGKPNQNQYFEVVKRLLVPGGISLLHTFTGAIERDPNTWATKYIFPGAYVPTWREIINLLPDHGFYLTDVESLRMHYALTMDRWAENFQANIEKVREMFDERFVRMWWLYLRSFAASFRSSGLDLHQFVFTKGLNNDLPLTRDHIYSA